MPKRASYSEPSRTKSFGMPYPVAQRKAERSHEENQERAYIAASRRADRSLEARVQSARMASDIHKKRTGKSFRISEEIVVKEEMYEEEDDDLPRSYRLLGPHMQTANHEMNSKVDAYLTNKMAMSAYLAKSADDWRSNEINQLFAQSFPNAGAQAQQLSQNMSSGAGSSSRQAQQQQNPVSPSFQTVDYSEQNQHSRQASISAAMSPTAATHPMSPSLIQTPAPDNSNNLGAHTATPSMTNATLTGGPSDFDNDSSAFTMELPNDVRMMMGGASIDPTNPFVQGYYGQDWATGGDAFLPSGDLDSNGSNNGKMDLMKGDPDAEVYQNELDPAMKWDPPAQPGMDEPTWDAFLNDSAWNSEQ